MEQYIVSARKYRPSTFDSVVGQDALTRTLRNAIQSDRLAHAYLFCGSRGVGKTSCARIFAKTINCTNRTSQGEACNECDSCRQFNENRSLNIIELDAASNNSVDDIRGLIDQVVVPPTQGKYRVFIVDEVHMLSTQAFNAFLKTLEEPPAHAIFILATTEKYKIIPTILSRCQIYDFNRISVADMVNHLRSVAQKEGIEAEDAALNVIAGKADGAMRDALSIFDQVAASGQGKITYQGAIDSLNVLDHTYYSRLLDAFMEGDVPKALLIYKEVRSKGFDSQFFINGLGLYFRDLMVASHPSTLPLVEAPDDVRQEMAARASRLNPTFLYRGMDLCNSADFNFRQATNKQFLIELTLIKLCQLSSPSPDEYGSDEGHLLPLKPATTQQAAGYSPIAETPKTQPRPATVDKVQERPVVTGTKRGTFQVGGHSIAELTRQARRQVEQTHSASPTAVTPTAEPVAAAPAAVRNQPFTAADVARAWTAIRQSTGNDRVLESALRECAPVADGNQAFHVDVPSEIQAESVRSALPRIVAMLRDALVNDSVTLEVRVMQGELPPKFWSEKMVREYIIKKHPNVRDFIAKYHLKEV
ncbi:MAG: DNA polymerase III subunit gamma/tau [Muribaculaceae bacterium]|nr:DNA polymerase III subunit gamma/tau [Muribaculaceae bacterium]